MSESTVLYTLPKEERLHSQKRIDSLFEKGESFIAYPLRIVFLTRDHIQEEPVSASILVSVSKRRFKRAVKRNRVKRLIKEAYRLNKHLLTIKEKSIDIAYLYLKNELPDYSEIEKAIKKSFVILSEKLQTEDEDKDHNS